MKRWGLLAVFALFFTACGSGQTILSDAGTTTPALNTSPDPQTTTSKSNDKNLEALVKQIHSPDYDNYLVVQVESAEGLDLSNGRLSVTDTHSLAGARSVNNTLDKVGSGVVLLPLFTQSRWLIDNVRKQLEVLNGKKLPDLNTFLKLSILNQDKAEDALRRLWKEAGIKSTYPGVKKSAPGMETLPDLSARPYQSYLYGDMSGGLNIDAVWRAGVRGAGVNVSNDDCSWNRNHENFNPPPSTQGESGFCDSIDTAHATATHGILAAADRGEHGTKGIVSESNVSTGSAGTTGMLVALDGIRDSNNPGDVYLWEAHIGSPLGYFVPMEMIPSVAAEMDIAAANGLVIIEPSGNGSHDLDDPSIYTSSEYTDLRTRRDSGIIMVGASVGGTRERLSQGNYGSRINLYSWGSGVVTTSYPNSPWVWTGPSPFVNDANQPNLFYTNGFNGTSSASAIIAGTAALLQSYAKQKMGLYKYLGPKKILDILYNSGRDYSMPDSLRNGRQPRMDVAMQLFDDYWAGIQREFPELVAGQELRGVRRQALMQRGMGIGLICKLYDPEHSDPSCPETAKCVLNPAVPVSYECSSGECSFTVWSDPIHTVDFCTSTRCLPIDTNQSDTDCLAGAIWPSGLRIGKTLDMDGDGKAELMNWTETKWQIDLSKNNLGAWDIDMTVPRVNGRWVWPVVEDYNSDGRADLSVYDKEHGVWHVKYTDKNILGGRWTSWDRQSQLPYHDELNRDVRLAKYSRPMPGDYNGDGYIDLALARSDGLWSIDYSGSQGPDGVFDKNINYLTADQLALAPGWAYLPVSRDALVSGEGVGVIAFKTPEEIQGGGEWWGVSARDGSRYRFLDNRGAPILVCGNNAIPVTTLVAKSSDGIWTEWDINRQNLITPSPNGMFGNSDCHPFTADFDGDSVDDRAVQCPTEFRIALSGTPGTLRTIPLGYDIRLFSLPGKIFVGGISYATSQQFLQWQLNNSAAAPVIPVDMVSLPSLCSIPWSGPTPQECR